MVLMIWPTGISARARARFMAYGNEEHILGVTDRVTLSYGMWTLRIAMDMFDTVVPHVRLQDSGESGAHLVGHCSNGVSIGAGSHPGVTLTKGFLGSWSMPLSPEGSWTIDSTHAGYVPCHGCLAPQEEAARARREVCTECKKLCTGSMEWWRLQQLFTFETALPKHNHVSIDGWRRVLGIGGNGA